MTVEPTTIYYGTRKDIIREIGGMAHIYPGKYLIFFDGDANWDLEGADTKKDLKEFLDYYRGVYPNARLAAI